MPANKRKNSNHNKKNEPPRKKQKRNSKNCVLFNQITSFDKQIYIQAFISDIGPIRVNTRNNSKFRLIVLMQITNGKIQSMRVYVYGKLLNTIKAFKRNDFVEVFICKIGKPKYGVITTTCDYIASIGGNAKGSIKKIKSQPMEFTIKNPSKNEIEDLSKDSDISVAAAVTNVSPPQQRKTKKGPQTVTNIGMNVDNKLNVKGQIWNLPQKSIKSGDIIQVIKGRKNEFNGQTSIVIMEYIINGDNSQSKKLKKMKLKKNNDLESFGVNFEKDYENADIFRINKLRKYQSELKKSNINYNSSQMQQLHFKRIKIVPEYVEHLPHSEEYWSDANNNQKLTQVGNRFYNKNKMQVSNKEMVFKHVFYVKDNEDIEGGIEITMWNDPAKLFYGISAENFCSLNGEEKVDLFQQKAEIKHEYWCQIKLDTWRNKEQLKFMVEHIKIAGDDSEYDFIEPSDDEYDSEVEDDAFLDVCENNIGLTDKEENDDSDFLNEDDDENNDEDD